MNTRNPAQAAAALAAVALVVLAGGGCSRKLRNELVPNQPPEVRLTGAPTDSKRPEFYAYAMQWAGYDPDGRVDHYLVAVDPPSPPGPYGPPDTNWRVTARNESTFFFRADSTYDPRNPQGARAEAPHVLSIFAVDDKGLRSPRPAVRAFTSYTLCPEVRITSPVPSVNFDPLVTPTVTIKWVGQDLDGQFTTKPVRWTFRLFGRKNPDFPAIPDFITFAITRSDSFRRLYAPTFQGWTHVGAETTSFQYRNLVTGSSYLFVVTGFDEAGAYDPVFANGRTMLKFVVTFAGTSGPTICMFNQFFNYCYTGGGYDPSETRWFRLEIPADQPVTFNWLATPPAGADIRRYRWVMDLVDLTDETPRSSEATDWYHWSAWSRNTTSATIGPFPPRRTDPHDPSPHLFYIEAEDNNGLRSLGIINFRAIRSSFEKPLLIVDDTRFRPDFRAGSGPNVNPPAGSWPTAAELDTFLFARGGFPWKSYPVGTLSPPGIFNGYEYDTIGTRGISLDGTVPLSLLGQYRHVVWYTDPTGAAYSLPPTDLTTPITALRLVSSPGRPVILATYMTQGGKVWLAGGGAAYATLIAWSRTNPPNDYTARDNELVPGRMMYDFAHWREGVQMFPAFSAPRFGMTSFGQGLNRPGRHWPPNPTPPTPPAPPDYSLLPPVLQAKSSATDPPPPLRSSGWMETSYSAEYIHRPTFIREDYGGRSFSTLDTLYITQGGTAFPNSPVMTYYHGLENQPMVFSGFNFWYWRRSQCIALVDWVLQSVWGLRRDPGAPRGVAAPVSAHRPAP